MALLLLLAAYIAILIWLTVRIVNRKERWAKRTLVVVIGLLVLYVLSFGPACWIYSRTVEQESWYTVWDIANRIYYPIFRQWDGSGPVSAAIDWYANLFSAAEVYCSYPTYGDPDDLGFGTGEPTE